MLKRILRNPGQDGGVEGPRVHLLSQKITHTKLQPTAEQALVKKTGTYQENFEIFLQIAMSNLLLFTNKGR